jgi:hypothetical protein
MKLATAERLSAIARNAWGTMDWESLDQGQLDALVAEVKKNAWKRKPAAASKRWGAGLPF